MDTWRTALQYLSNKTYFEIDLKCAESQSETEFMLYIRMPKWVTKTYLMVDGCLKVFNIVYALFLYPLETMRIFLLF